MGVIDKSAVSNDSESEFELFGPVFKENIKVEVEPRKTGKDDVVYPYCATLAQTLLKQWGLRSVPRIRIRFNFYDFFITSCFCFRFSHDTPTVDEKSFY